MRRILSVAELQRRLGEVRPHVEALAEGDSRPALASIRDQLAHLQGIATRGVPPTPAERDQLHFGLLASQHLHEVDPLLAENLYAIASWVTFWR